MNTLNRQAYILAMCLSALAGCVDAIGFLQLSGHFISFMSGNSTQLAVSLVTGTHRGAWLLMGILFLFVLGAMAGAFVRHFSKTTPAVAVLAFVTLLLAGAAGSYAIGHHFAAIAFMTLAMGAENAVFQRNGEVVVGLTYMTGTLVKVGQKLAGALLGGDAWAWAPYLMLWLGLILGGVTGALLFHFLGMDSLWIAVFWSLCLTLAAKYAKHSLP